MGRMRELDDRIDQLGYLRLNTPQPVTRLIGNVISPEMAQVARHDGIETSAKAVKETQGWVKRVLQIAGSEWHCPEESTTGYSRSSIRKGFMRVKEETG